MEVRTTEPGIQVYDGSSVNVSVPGLDGRKMGPGAGIALEPQVWPDSPRRPDFPQATLRPGETYRQHTQYIFAKDKA
jgi:aldose 1-epimerase